MQMRGVVDNPQTETWFPAAACSVPRLKKPYIDAKYDKAWFILSPLESTESIESTRVHQSPQTVALVRYF
jgi:hypothetical protein